VALHIPGTAENRGFIDAGRLARLPARAILVNTSRGVVVDEEALFDALSGGGLAAAGLDVFADEPYVPVAPGKDLRTLPNVLLTPHVSSNTEAACSRMAERALANIRLAAKGAYERMDLVNPEAVGRAGQ
jgi:phosphoglycerate dehydrogenase-like enzyme